MRKLSRLNTSSNDGLISDIDGIINEISSAWNSNDPEQYKSLNFAWYVKILTEAKNQLSQQGV